MGIVQSVINESLPPKSNFTVDDIPDLSGKVAIVTGSTSGIGKETVKALLAHNTKVYIAARNKQNAEATIEDLKIQTGKTALYLNLDLADLKSVKAAAEDFLSKEQQLHVLFNNAGVMMPPIEQTTTLGHDLQFATNVIGHFYFTKLLLPTLISTAPSSPDGKARVVNVASMGHLFSTAFDFNTLKDGPARRKTAPWQLYYRSKLGNVVYSTELARRYGDQGIVSTTVNPGNLATGLHRHVPSAARWIIHRCLYSPAQGALTQLWAGTSPEGANFNGKYLIPWARIGSARPDSQDPNLGKELWTWLEEQVEDI